MTPPMLSKDESYVALYCERTIVRQLGLVSEIISEEVSEITSITF